jgi:hypothetical protein
MCLFDLSAGEVYLIVGLRERSLRVTKRAQRENNGRQRGDCKRERRQRLGSTSSVKTRATNSRKNKPACSCMADSLNAS